MSSKMSIVATDFRLQEWAPRSGNVRAAWSHARRRFDEAVKALPKAMRKDSRAYLALTMIQAIYREEKLLRDLPAEERKTRRQFSVRPLVEAYFTWARETILKVPQKSKTWEGLNYSILRKQRKRTT